MSSYWSLLILASLSASGVVGAAVVSRRVARVPNWVREGLLRIALLVAGASLVLLPAEAYFRCCVAESDGINAALASRLWMQRYWQPVNSLGYRDDEHPPAALAGKRVLLLVGDSYVAGHGIEDYRQRMSATLQDQLGAAWVVITVAGNGWATEDEAAALERYPIIPEVVVLAYNVNDIVGASDLLGRPEPVALPAPPGVLIPAIDHSYLANFAYWRLFRWAHADLASRYQAWEAELFADPVVWQAHTRALQRIVNDAHADRSILLAALLPELSNPKGSVPLTARVGTYLAQQGVPSVDFSLILSDRDPRTLIVSPVDPHPNAALHHEIGKRLALLVETNTAAGRS